MEKKDKKPQSIPWTPELEQRIQYVEKCYDDARARGLDVLKMLLSTSVVIAGVPIVFYQQMVGLFQERAIYFIYFSWVTILLSLIVGFLAHLFIFEGYYHRSHREVYRWLDINPVLEVKYDNQANAFFDKAHYAGLAVAVLFGLSILSVCSAILFKFCPFVHHSSGNKGHFILYLAAIIGMFSTLILGKLSKKEAPRKENTPMDKSSKWMCPGDLLLRVLLAGYLCLVFWSLVNSHIWFTLFLAFTFIICSGFFRIKPVKALTLVSLILLLSQVVEQRNDNLFKRRPYLDITPISFDMTQDLPNTSDKIFKLSLAIQNSGTIGSILEDFEYVPFKSPDNRFLDAGEKIEAIPLSSLNQKYGVIDWVNAPIFPNKEIQQTITNAPFGKSDFIKLGSRNENVYFWFKIRYRPIGDTRSFYLWAIVKSVEGGEFRFVKAGDSDRSFMTEYGISV